MIRGLRLYNQGVRASHDYNALRIKMTQPINVEATESVLKQYSDFATETATTEMNFIHERWLHDDKWELDGRVTTGSVIIKQQAFQPANPIGIGEQSILRRWQCANRLCKHIALSNPPSISWKRWHDILLKQWTLINQVYIVVLDEIMTDKLFAQQQQQHHTSTESVCLKDHGGVRSAHLSPFPVSNNN